MTQTREFYGSVEILHANGPPIHTHECITRTVNLLDEFKDIVDA